MLNDATCYNSINTMQMQDAQNFTSVVRQMDWSREDQDVVMDIGCGSGNTLLKVLFPTFPRVRKVVAIDSLPSMVEYAQKHNAHEKIEYHLVDFTDWVSISRWADQITKAVSVYCFHWFKSQRKAFQNLFHLLRPGGGAALLFALRSTLFDAHQTILDSAKWQKHLQGADPHIPASHSAGHDVVHYRKLLEEVGFVVEFIGSEDRVHRFPDEEEYADFFFCVNSLTKYIPDELKADFREDCLQAGLALSTRGTDGSIEFRHRVLYLLIRKPDHLAHLITDE